MADHDAALNEKFLQFCSFGTRQPETQLDGAKFTKLCRDSGIIDKKCTQVDVELIFAKVKAKTARKISFPEFKQALQLLAEKKGTTSEEIEGQLKGADGPQVKATQPDFVKFHDDKSTYTGVYANGGPTNFDGNKDLSSLADRSKADVRGVPVATGQVFAK